MPHTYDVIVVGCGGFGSSAMSHLSRRGLRVLGIDRFTPPHDRGSTHGETRIIRKAYFEHPDYVPLLQRSYQLWDELHERRSAASGPLPPFFERCGLLATGTMSGEMIPGVLESAKTHGLSVDQLSPGETRERFPMFRVPEEYTTLFEQDAGYLWVERCVEAHLADAAEHGATLLTDQVVTEISHTPASATVQTLHGSYSAAAVVVTSGAWTGQLLPDYARLIEVRRKLLFWYPMNSDAWRGHRPPTYMTEIPGSNAAFYGFPPIDGQTLKMAEHTGGQVVADPLTVDRCVQPSESASVSDFAGRFLNGVSTSPVKSAVCMYSMSPDGHFLVDRLQTGPVIVAAGFSGHGFKFTSAMGEVVADLVQSGNSRLPIEFLSARRFD
jgi:sarcosine oxidase